MRVNSGKYKGRLILPPKNDNVRPTTDKVKEAIFGVLSRETEGAVVVDLFAGSGALGIEALSRGAKKVFFCDASSESVELLKKNTAFLEEGSFEILRGDYTDCLARLAGRGIQADIVLCDPPYGKGIPELALSAISEKNILVKNGVVCVEREIYDMPARKNFAYVSEKTYGKTSLDFYRNETKCAVTGTFDPFTLGHRFVVDKALADYDFCYVVMLQNEEKQARYSVKNRLRMIELSLKDVKKRVRIEFSEGWTVDYCKENGIDVIYRGVRNESDATYEKEMAEYNRVHGDVRTVLVQAENEISSSLVKQKFDAGESVLGLVDEDVIGLMRKR